MGKSVDEFIEVFEYEVRTGGAALLQELLDLAYAIKEDLDKLSPEKENQSNE